MMNEVKVLLVDDEPLARINIREALQPYSNWQVVGELSSGQSIAAVMKQLQPDVIFLDIQMPGENGIEIAQKLMQSEGFPQIIFVTAYDEYAVNAFELCALDYLLKPFDDERFSQSIKRLEHVLNHQAQLQPLQQWQKHHLQQQQKLDKILIRSVGSIRIIPVAEIFWFASCGNYVEVHHQEGMHLHRVSLSFLETRLDATEFCRVHRSAIVKISVIKEFKTADDQTHRLVLSDGSLVKVSPVYKERLLARLSV